MTTTTVRLSFNKFPLPSEQNCDRSPDCPEGYLWQVIPSPRGWQLRLLLCPRNLARHRNPMPFYHDNESQAWPRIPRNTNQFWIDMVHHRFGSTKVGCGSGASFRTRPRHARSTPNCRQPGGKSGNAGGEVSLPGQRRVAWHKVDLSPVDMPGHSKNRRTSAEWMFFVSIVNVAVRRAAGHRGLNSHEQRSAAFLAAEHRAFP